MTPTVKKIKYITKGLNKKGKTVKFQWILSIDDIDGNENGYNLQKGMQKYLLNRLLLQSFRKSNQENIILTHDREQSVKLTD